MSHSIEVRVPLVDAFLFRAAAPWLVSQRPPTKADAAAAPLHELAQDVLDRPKTGFSVPVREWLSSDSRMNGNPGRGLRKWARHILPPRPRQFRALVLVTDAFGGYGGIAKYNRDFIAALAEMPECAEVVAIPRLVPAPMEPIPPRVKFLHSAAGTKRRFVMTALAQAVAGPFDVVFIGHINLASIGAGIAGFLSTRTALTIYGIDAWTRHNSWLIRNSLRRMSTVITISAITQRRFNDWAHIEEGRFQLLPPAVDLSLFQPGTKSAELATKLRLDGRKVLMTFGRLASEERYKGIDVVIEALPGLAKVDPNIAYLVCGDGPDRARLESKAAALGVGDRVTFAGFVEESQKADYYRLADAYVMPSQGEGFGIVLLEAMASGVPALGSTKDGTQEALAYGALGDLVDPSDAQAVQRGILRTLSRGKGIPAGLEQFSAEAFRARIAQVLHSVLGH